MEKENKISIKEVEHIAELARIELKEEEKKEFSGQLSDVLGYIEQLNELDTENVESVSRVMGMNNVMREDKVEESDEEMREVIVGNFPAEQDGYVKVKQVL